MKEEKSHCHHSYYARLMLTVVYFTGLNQCRHSNSSRNEKWEGPLLFTSR
jgi:hypothetical protein